MLRNYRSDSEWSDKLSLPIFKGCDRLFNNDSVEYLNEIIYLTNANIVITSNWRIRLPFEDLRQALRDRGVVGFVEGTTETFTSHTKPFPVGNRGLEILKYIRDNNIVDKYVIIDDQISDIINLIDNSKVVKINPLECLTSKDVDKILNILL